ASTGVAGNPEEFFESTHEPAWRKYFSIDPKKNYIEGLIAKTQSGNGMFGAKLFWGHLEYLCGLLSRDESKRRSPLLAIVEKAFPGTRFLWLRRHNKIAQAVSHARALQTGWWRQTKDSPSTRPFEEYSFEKIETQMRNLEYEEARWQKSFRRVNIKPCFL